MDKNLMNMKLAPLLLIVLLVQCRSTDSSTVVEVSTGVIDDQAVTTIDSTLNAFVEAGEVAGISALIFEKGEEVYFNAMGYADREQEVAMSRQTIVQIYSMTKPLTGTALMKLYEQGAFHLDDPVEQYIEEFKGMKVYDAVDEAGNVTSVSPKRLMTIRDLTRHTAGFCNNGDVPGLSTLMRQANPRDRNNTLTQMAEKLASVPLWFHPGSQWEYGPSVDVQALLVERLSGKPYQEFLKEVVLDPLQMTETRYLVPESDRQRLAKMYRREGPGDLSRIPDSIALAYNTREFPFRSGGSGLTSTLDNYMKFCQMLLKKGTIHNEAFLKSETVELMATNHLSDSVEERSWLPGKGQVGFGIDFAVRLRPPVDEKEKYGVVGEFFWDGAASTLFWIDPENELAAVMFVQLFPYDPISLHKNFRDAVYSSYKQ